MTCSCGVRRSCNMQRDHVLMNSDGAVGSWSLSLAWDQIIRARFLKTSINLTQG